jgi:hypothetical protein
LLRSRAPVDPTFTETVAPATVATSVMWIPVRPQRYDTRSAVAGSAFAARRAGT